MKKFFSSIANATGAVKAFCKKESYARTAFAIAGISVLVYALLWVSATITAPDISAYTLPDQGRASGQSYNPENKSYMNWHPAYFLENYSERAAWEFSLNRSDDQYTIYWELGAGTRFNDTKRFKKDKVRFFYYTVDPKMNIEEVSQKFIEAQSQIDFDNYIYINIAYVERKDARRVNEFLTKIYPRFYGLYLNSDQLNWGEWNRKIVNTSRVWLSDGFTEETVMEDARSIDLKRFEHLGGWGNKKISWIGNSSSGEQPSVSTGAKKASATTTTTAVTALHNPAVAKPKSPGFSTNNKPSDESDSKTGYVDKDKVDKEFG